ncbi:MAG: hypothetical protein IJU20_00420 [Clostridia bacterium]|nr:hypothetical protein [Clostridia bacterium]
MKRLLVIGLVLALLCAALASCSIGDTIKDGINSIGKTDAEKMQAVLEKKDNALLESGEITGKFTAKDKDGVELVHNQETYLFLNRGKENMKAYAVATSLTGDKSRPLYYENGTMYVENTVKNRGAATAADVDRVLESGYSYTAYLLAQTVWGKTPFAAEQNADTKNWKGSYDVSKETLIVLAAMNGLKIDLTADSVKKARLQFEATENGLPLTAELTMDAYTGSLFSGEKDVAVEFKIEISFLHGSKTASDIPSVSTPENYVELGGVAKAVRANMCLGIKVISPVAGMELLITTSKGDEVEKNGLSYTGKFEGDKLTFNFSTYTMDQLGTKTVSNQIVFDGEVMKTTDPLKTETETLTKSDLMDVTAGTLLFKGMSVSNLSRTMQSCSLTDNVLTGRLSDEDVRSVLGFYDPEEECEIKSNSVVFTLNDAGDLESIVLNVSAVKGGVEYSRNESATFPSDNG